MFKKNFSVALILCIETATRSCSVALSKDGTIISLKESSEKNTHSVLLTKFISEVLSDTGCKYSGLDAIAVGSGPGSYTGLRIGVSTAKGLCYAIDKPLISVGTLATLSMGMRSVFRNESGGLKPLLFCPMIDARRMEVYTALYDTKGEEIKPPSAEILTGESFTDLLTGHCIVFAGDGAEKCRNFLNDIPNAVFLDDLIVSSRYMAELAEQKFNAGIFEDVAYFEPFYLKDFVAGRPTVKGLK